MIEEVAVVRDTNHRACVLLQVLLQPVDTLRIKVVGRLVQQQDIRLLQEQSAERHAAPLAARQRLHICVVGGTTQRVHRAVEFLVDVPCVCAIQLVLQLRLPRQQRVEVGIRLCEGSVYLVVLAQHVHHGLHALLHYLANGLRRVQFRVLLQIAHRVARREHHFALVVRLHACDNLHQRGLTRAVQTDDAYLRTIEKTQIDVVQYFFLRRETLAHAHHGKDNLLVVCHKG